jgi:hypothetical protein
MTSPRPPLASTYWPVTQPESGEARRAPVSVPLELEALEESCRLLERAHVALEGERLPARRFDLADGGARRLGLAPVVDADQRPVPARGRVAMVQTKVSALPAG